MGMHWIIFIAVIIIFVQAAIYKRIALKKISYTRHFSERAIFQGQAAEMIEIVTNSKWLPLPWLRIESLVHADLVFQTSDNFDVSSGTIYQNHKSLFSLMPMTKIRRRHQLIGAQRGCYRLHTATITSGDLLGLHQVYKEFSLDSEMLVYPKILSIDELQLPSHSFLGDLTVRRWTMEDPFMVAGTREYQSGDSMRLINWPATSRTGSLQVQQHDYTANPRLMIYVNVEVSEHMWHTVTDVPLIERFISYAASIANYALHTGVETGFGCNGMSVDKENEPLWISPASGTAHFYHMLECMARLKIEVAMDFHTFLEQDIQAGTQYTDFVLLTPYVNSRMHSLIHRLEQSSNAVHIIEVVPDA